MNINDIIRELTSENGELTVLKNQVNSWSLNDASFDSIQKKISEIDNKINQTLTRKVQEYHVDPKALYSPIRESLEQIKVNFIYRVIDKNSPQEFDNDMKQNLTHATLLIAENRLEEAEDFLERLDELFDEYKENQPRSAVIEAFQTEINKLFTQLDNQKTKTNNIFTKMKLKMESLGANQVIRFERTNIPEVDEEDRKKTIKSTVKGTLTAGLVIFTAFFAGCAADKIQEGKSEKENAIVQELDEEDTVQKLTFAVDEDHNFNINDAITQEEKGYELMKFALESGFDLSAKDANNYIMWLNMGDLTTETMAVRIQNETIDENNIYNSFTKLANEFGCYSAFGDVNNEPFLYKFIASKKESARMLELEEAMILSKKGDNSKLTEIAEYIANGENGLDQETNSAVDLQMIWLLYHSGQLDESLEKALTTACAEDEKAPKTSYHSAQATSIKYLRTLLHDARYMSYYDLENYINILEGNQNITNIQIEKNIQNQIELNGIQRANIDWLKIMMEKNGKVQSAGSITGTAPVSQAKTTTVSNLKASEASPEVKAILDKQVDKSNDVSYLDIAKAEALKNGLSFVLNSDGTAVLEKNEDGLVTEWLNPNGEKDLDLKESEEVTYQDILDNAKDTTFIKDEDGDRKEVAVVDRSDEIEEKPGYIINSSQTEYRNPEGETGEVIGNEKETDDYMDRHEGEVRIKVNGKWIWVDKEDLYKYVDDMDAVDKDQYGGNDKKSDLESDYKNDFDPSEDEFTDITPEEDKKDDAEVEKPSKPNEDQSSYRDPAKSRIVIDGATYDAYACFDDTEYVNRTSISQLIEEIKAMLGITERDESLDKPFEEEIVNVEQNSLEAQTETVVEETQVESEPVIEEEPEAVVYSEPSESAIQAQIAQYEEIKELLIQEASYDEPELTLENEGSQLTL